MCVDSISQLLNMDENLSLIHDHQISSLPTDDLYLHLDDFLNICDLFKIKGVFNDAIRLGPFPL